MKKKWKKIIMHCVIFCAQSDRTVHFHHDHTTWNKNNTNYYNCFTVLCLGLTGWVSTRNIHPLTYPDHYPTLLSFFHLLWSIASSLFNLRAWQSFCTTSLQVLFGLPLGLQPSTSYSIHFFIQISVFATHAHTITAWFAVVPRLNIIH